MNFKNLGIWRRKKLTEYGIREFYYFSFIDNVEGILQNGILSKNEVENRNLNYNSFADEAVQERRHTRSIRLTDGKFHNIHDLVPLYLTPKTPTLFARKENQGSIFFAVVQSSILWDKGIEFAFSDGNAASENTQFYYSLNKLDMIPWEVIRADYWKDFDDGKRKRNSEFLIYPHVPIERICQFVVNSVENRSYIDNIKQKYGINIEVKIDHSFFF